MMTKEQFLRHIGLTEEELMHTSIPVSYREEGDPMFVFREKYSLDGVDSLPDDLVIGGSSEIDMKARITRPVAALVKCLSDNGYIH